jgi:hypothetical protein
VTVFTLCPSSAKAQKVNFIFPLIAPKQEILGQEKVPSEVAGVESPGRIPFTGL